MGYILQRKIKNNLINPSFFIRLFLISLSFTLGSCYVLGTGASSISKEIQTIQIEDFINENNLYPAPADLINQTKIYLANFFRQDKLTLVDKEGDIVIEGSFTDYKLEDINPDFSNNMAQNSRIYVGIRIKYDNPKEQKGFNEKFSDNQTILSEGKTLLDAEDYNNEIAKRLARTIYAAIANEW